MKTPFNEEDALRIREALDTLLGYGIGSHEFASLAGTAYPLPREKVLLTTEEAAERWNLSRWTIYRWVKEGRLRPITGAKSWMFKEGDVEDALRRL